MFVEGKSEEAIEDWLRCTTPTEANDTLLCVAIYGFLLKEHSGPCSNGISIYSFIKGNCSMKIIVLEHHLIGKWNQ